MQQKTKQTNNNNNKNPPGDSLLPPLSFYKLRKEPRSNTTTEPQRLEISTAAVSIGFTDSVGTGYSRNTWETGADVL